jgi:predicted dinucleotide-binding enzyme
MKIAVIGSGNMGSGLTKALVAANQEVIVGHRDPAKAAAIAAEFGGKVEASDIASALKLADIVFLAMPYQASIEVVKAAGDLSGKILVDISNPVTADYSGLEIGHTTSAAEQIQTAAPTAKVVKGFNTIFAQLLTNEGRKGATLQTFIAGDEAAIVSVSALATAMGFEPVASGALSNSRFLEPLGAMNIQFGFFLGRGPTTAPAWVSI